MRMESITVQTPGKLMLAGEFAVLEPNQKLIVMAVDRFVYTNLVESEKNIVHLPNFSLNQLQWKFVDEQVTFASKDERIQFVQMAMQITFDYLRENSIQVTPFTLTVRSELDDPKSGAKYGLGSSAAVVTSVVEAILTHGLNDAPDKELIFKLASMAHVRTQGNGSGADIAASTYSGVLEYTSFQAEWLLQAMDQMESVTALVRSDWIYLSVEQTAIPQDVDIFVGWTGKPASTKSLVNEVLALKKSAPHTFTAFLEESSRAVEKIVHGMNQDDIALFLAGISDNRRALAKVGNEAKVPIETEKLATLSDIAEQFGGAGKLSGAGGGDCGLAFVEAEVNVPAMHKAWINETIEPLDIQIYYRK